MHRWNSDQTSEKHWQICTVSTVSLDPFSSIPKVAFFFFFQYLMVAAEWKLVELIFFCCGKIIYSWRQSAATDGVCEQSTLTRHIFSCLSALIMMSHTALAQGVSARHTIHVSCAWVSDFSSTVHFALTLHSLSHLLLRPPDLSLHLLCGSVQS